MLYAAVIIWSTFLRHFLWKQLCLPSKRSPTTSGKYKKKNSSDIDSTWHSSSHSFIHEIYIYMCTTLIMFPIIFVKIPMFVRPKIHIPIIGHNLVFYYARGAFVLWFIQTFWMDAQMLSRAVNRLRSSLAVNAIVVVGITQLCQYFWVSTLTRLVRWKKQAIFEKKMYFFMPRSIWVYEVTCFRLIEI